MKMRIYQVTIYGRTNTILSGIRNERLYTEIVVTTNKKNAKDIALNDFYMFIDEVWEALINRYDIRVECDDVTLDVRKDEETIYLNEMLKDGKNA